MEKLSKNDFTSVSLKADAYRRTVPRDHLTKIQEIRGINLDWPVL